MHDSAFRHFGSLSWPRDRTARKTSVSAESHEFRGLKNLVEVRGIDPPQIRVVAQGSTGHCDQIVTHFSSPLWAQWARLLNAHGKQACFRPPKHL
jgi:hypothetical protein